MPITWDFVVAVTQLEFLVFNKETLQPVEWITFSHLVCTELKVQRERAFLELPNSCTLNLLVFLDCLPLLLATQEVTKPVELLEMLVAGQPTITQQPTIRTLEEEVVEMVVEVVKVATTGHPVP